MDLQCLPYPPNSAPHAHRGKKADATHTGVDQIQLKNVQNQVLGWGMHHVVRSAGVTYRLLCHYFLNADSYNLEVI